MIYFKILQVKHRIVEHMRGCSNGIFHRPYLSKCLVDQLSFLMGFHHAVSYSVMYNNSMLNDCSHLLYFLIKITG